MGLAELESVAPVCVASSKIKLKSEYIDVEEMQTTSACLSCSVSNYLQIATHAMDSSLREKQVITITNFFTFPMFLMSMLMSKMLWKKLVGVINAIKTGGFTETNDGPALRETSTSRAIENKILFRMFIFNCNCIADWTNGKLGFELKARSSKHCSIEAQLWVKIINFRIKFARLLTKVFK